jgi:hypothetical protein
MVRNEILQDPHHLGVSLSASNTILEPMVCSVQTVHVSCVKISTISKKAEMSFCLSLITSEYHWVHLKWFLTLWYVRRKPITYLASRLALSPKGPKQASTWSSSSRNSIGCIENNFLACGTFAKPAHLSSTYTNTVSKKDRNEIRVPSSASKIVSEPMVCSAQTVHLSCVKIITVSKWTKMKFHMTHVT